MGLGVHFSLSGLGLNLAWVHRPCACCYSLCEFISATVLLHKFRNRKMLFLGVIRPLWLLDLSASSSVWIREPRGERFYEDAPVTTGCSMVSHSLHFVWLWISVVVVVVFSDEAMICACSSVPLGVILLLCAFRKAIVLVFSLGQ